MSMFARKGTMVHRKGNRRASQPALRRSSVVSVPPSRRRSVALSSNVEQRSYTRSPVNRTLEYSSRANLTATSRASFSARPTRGPGVAVAAKISSPSRKSSASGPRRSLDGRDERKLEGTVVIPVDDTRQLYQKSENPGFLKYTSCGSIIYQLREANEEATGLVDFTCRALNVIGSSAPSIVFLGCFSILPVLMMIIGIQYLHDCPKQPNIPVYLLVGGAFGLIKIISVGWRQTRERKYEQTTEAVTRADVDEVLITTSSKLTDLALSVFLLVWFVFGNYWVLEIYKPRFEPLLHDPNNWCAKPVYLFSLIHLSICYGVMIVAIVFLGALILSIRTCGVCQQKM
ncbi:transmembrane protein 272-like isoform X1 [Tachypleus tridentatus]|uniref:transmembrane protein 272-like isoform X1 n=1 Tax=Tachypleus tridentatus TaxID=6853 RepID=UPI003FD13845